MRTAVCLNRSENETTGRWRYGTTEDPFKCYVRNRRFPHVFHKYTTTGRSYCSTRNRKVDHGQIHTGCSVPEQVSSFATIRLVQRCDMCRTLCEADLTMNLLCRLVAHWQDVFSGKQLPSEATRVWDTRQNRT